MCSKNVSGVLIHYNVSCGDPLPRKTHARLVLFENSYLEEHSLDVSGDRISVHAETEKRMNQILKNARTS